MDQMYVNQKNCASCEYWMGKREVALAPGWIKLINGYNGKGKCCGQGPWRGLDIAPGYTCKGYQKWRYL